MIKFYINPDFFKRMLFVAALALTVGKLSAQTTEDIIKLSGNKVSQGKIVEAIRNQTGFRVAYTGTTLDTSKIVTLPEGILSVKKALNAMVENAGMSYQVEGKYIAFIPQPPGTVVESASPFRADNGYVANRLNDISSTPLLRPGIESVKEGKEQFVLTEILEGPTSPVYYSDYKDPDLYKGIAGSTPRWAIKTNIFYAAYTLTPNLSAELGLGPRSTLEFTGSYNPWNWKHYEENKKHVHLLLQSEFRWWACERFNGHFFGAHLLFTQYNVNATKVPLLFEKDKNYEGFGYGAGVSYGYHLPLSKRWGLEFNAGVGAVYLDYDVYNCGECGDFEKKDSKWYFGPTKLGVSLVFMLK